MILFLRILFTVWWGTLLVSLGISAQLGLERDVEIVGQLAMLVLIGIPTGIVWTPWLADRLCGPMMGVLTDSTFYDSKRTLRKFMLWAHYKGHRRSALFVAILEGLFHPYEAEAFIIGLQNTRPGSWLEKNFASEVFRFNNVQNAVKAAEILRSHGIPPREHRTNEISIILKHLRRFRKPDPALLKVPKLPPVQKMPRNGRIKLFAGADKAGASGVVRGSTKAGGGV